MMRYIFAAAAGLGFATAAQAQTALTYLTDEAVETALVEGGAESVTKVSEPDQEPVWAGEFGGQIVYANGVACDDDFKSCQGLRLISIFPFPEGLAEKDEFVLKANEFFAATKVVTFDEENWMINFYIILNGGVTQENLNEVTRVYVDLAESTVERMSLTGAD